MCVGCLRRVCASPVGEAVWGQVLPAHSFERRVVEWMVACGAWRFAGWRIAERRGRRSETACRGAGEGSCLAHSSAVGCGLRPPRDFAAVLGAQGFVGRSRRSGPVLTARRTAPLSLLGPAARGDPGHLRASPLPRSRGRNPHPPRSATPRLAEVRQKNALAKASGTAGHGARAVALREPGRCRRGLALPRAVARTAREFLGGA